MRKYFLTLCLLCFATVVMAADAVNWSFRLIGDNTENPAIEMSAQISPGFHLFSPDNPPGGSNPLEFLFETQGCSLDGKPVANKPYTKQFDEIFEVDQHFYTGSVTFTQKIKPSSKKFSINVELKGQACDDKGCFPVFASHSFDGNAIIKEKISQTDIPEKKDTPENESDKTKEVSSTESGDSLRNTDKTSELAVSSIDNPDTTSSWWDNVETELKEFSDNPTQQERSLLYIFLAGFLGGLIALVTPCVWPMIPMTVSFFLKQNKTKKKSVATAAVYGLSIIVIYVGLGLVVTALFGASALNELATSAVFNIIFFLLLVLFAISFMGGFELTLPASWTNKMDSKVDSTTGWLSIFFMAFTLVLVSFSCTGPIIGTLLVEAASTSNFISPAIGMLGFSLALALPFSIFAMFPTMMKSMPKSGGWMNTVKVVLGFLELALALKFLSVADLAYGWRILDREVFISLWIVIFALLGVYLLGKLTFPHDDKVEKISVTRFMLACVSFAFAVYMIPGLWGAPLKSISAFSPPISTQDFSLYDGDVHAQVDDFEEGMKLAKKLGKPALIDFSGYGCVNCRKMEAAVWTDPEVKASIDNDFVLITLMVDEKKALPEPIKVTEKDGTVRTLRTYGDKWSYLQRSKFGANAQPFHVIVDDNGKPLAPAFAYNEDIPAYMRFLNQGISNYKK
ncbi:MAG: thioredoxin family protein [Muribaculaceae bacterium]|nr:thioredoxin family protein [Muribaculaceae bacterium]